MTDSPVPQTILVGAGVVGCAILKAHLDAGVSVCLADQEASSLESAVDAMRLSATSWQTESIRLPGTSLVAVRFVPRSNQSDSARQPIIIESISEKLDVKQAFFREAEDWLGAEALLCSNTSTLRISDIASALTRPERFCGMHFFMPV